MNIQERITFFNRSNAPLSIVAHDNGKFSLGLELNGDYGQSAFNRFAEQIGDPVKQNGLYTHGSGYEWETVFRKAFEDDPRLSQIAFDCEAGGFFCYTNDLTLLMNFGQRFRILCEDQNRFSELVCTALREAARSVIASDRSPREIMRLELSYDSELNHKTYHAELSLPATDAEIEDAMHQLRCMGIGAPEITVHTEVIPELIRSNVTGSLSEYNAFAIRMNLLSEEFTAMCTVINDMLSVTISGITMADLINMTYSPDAISVISNVRNDTELGQYVIEHDLNEDVSAVPEASRYLLDAEKIGKLQREVDRGWFDGSNYYVMHEIWRSDVYDGETLPDELQPEKTPFEILADGRISSPIFPLNQIRCRYFEGKTELREIEQRWNQMSPVQRMTLKAILAAEKPSSLKDAQFLTDHLYRFQVSVSVDHDEDFAKLFLQYHLPFLTDDEFFDRLSLYEFGTEVMKRMNVTVTDYGAVSEYGGTLYERTGRQMPDRNEVYELIEVCGRKALFTNEKLYNRNVPKGLYCYDIRTDGHGNFCTLEANVYVNHGGSVLFREPVELGKEEYIAFDEESSPHYTGEVMTVDAFADATFDEEGTEDMNNGESSVNTPSEEYTEEDGMGGMELC